jgi:quinol monooxygenase YgiN
MIIVTGTANIPADRHAVFAEIAERQVVHSRQEAGNVSYAYFEDAMTPGRFFFYEEWRDQAAIDFHFAQSYCLEFIAKVRALASSPPEIRIHRVTPE